MKALPIAALLVLAHTASRASECPEFAAARIVGTVALSALDELSGLAASASNPGILWTHNDKSGQNAVFAITESGDWRGSWLLSGAPASDWEDIALGPGPGGTHVYIADTGDNNTNRANYLIHRFIEPDVPLAGEPVIRHVSNYQTLRFRYPQDAKYDAETLLVDPLTGQVAVVTRDRQGSGFSRFFRFTSPVPWDGVFAEPTLVSSLFITGGMHVKGGDISPDGRNMALVYHNNSSGRTELRVYTRSPVGEFAFSTSHCRIIAHPDTPQTEALAWRPDGGAIYTTSEGSNRPIYTLAGVPPPPLLYINEFMAANSRTLADNFGEFDDWIEIFNAGYVEIDMGGMYLSDTLSQPTMWRFPTGTTIPPRGFLLVWADGSTNQTAPGFLHTNFSLSREGEAIGLFDRDEFGNRMIHGFTFGPQDTDVSFGLTPDGRGTPVRQGAPTPGTWNVAPSAEGWMAR